MDPMAEVVGENVYRTPKRTLKWSPDTPIGLDGKLERLTIDQTASPTLRGLVRHNSISIGNEYLNQEHADQGAASGGNEISLRRIVMGRRRVLDAEERLDESHKSSVLMDEEKLNKKYL